MESVLNKFVQSPESGIRSALFKIYFKENSGQLDGETETKLQLQGVGVLLAVGYSDAKIGSSPQR